MKRWLLACLILLGNLALADEAPSLRLYRLQGLHFGHFVVDPSGGTLELTPEGLLKPSPGLRALAGNPAVVGRIVVEGPAGRQFRLDFDPVRPSLHAPGVTPRIERFVLLPDATTFTLNGEGRAEIRIGAVLDLPAGTYPGLTRALPEVQIRARFIDTKADEGASPALFLPIQAILRAPMSLDCLRHLHFGDLVPGTGGGSLRVAPDGSFQWSGSEPASFLRRRPVAARFRLQGTPGSGYNLRLPRQEVFLTGPGAPLPLRDFQSDVPLEGRLPGGGLEFGVGATLVLPARAPSGAYVGSFRVEVDYN